MKIRYLGHSAFQISGSQTVVTDPYNNIGFDMPMVRADICLSSHSHFDHNAVQKVGAKTIVLSDKDAWRAREISLKAFKTFHDTVEGEKRGINYVYTFEIDGIKFCHLGDLGEDLSIDFINKLGIIDVLFVPVGGVFTFSTSTAVDYVRAIRPKVVIPMHYKTFQSTIKVAELSEFLKIAPFKAIRKKEEFILLAADLEGETKIILADDSAY